MSKDRKIKRVPIESVLPVTGVVKKRVEKYASMPASTQPPIETLNGYVVNGNHRWFASLMRGDRCIATQESDLPNTTKERWLRLIGG